MGVAINGEVWWKRPVRFQVTERQKRTIRPMELSPEPSNTRSTASHHRWIAAA